MGKQIVNQVTVKMATMVITDEHARSEIAANPQGARCRDCDKNTYPLKANGKPNWKEWENYVASDAVWIEAGMARKRDADAKRWFTGFLCLSCLSTRLGRVPVPGTDLLLWPMSASKAGLTVGVTKEYTERVCRGRGY